MLKGLSYLLLVDHNFNKLIIHLMNDQKISPWTFLKQRVEAQNYAAKLNSKLQLPRIVKKRQSLSKQQNQSSPIIFKSRKGATRNVKTMILLQRLEDISSSTKMPLKKKTEPILIKNEEVSDQILIKAENLSYLNDLMLAAKIIRSSLEEENRNQVKNDESSKLTIEQIKKKVLSIPQIMNSQYNSDNIRIHDKNIEVKMSAIRSILKREYQGSQKLKNRVANDKKSSIVSCFKLKIAQNNSKAH